MQGSANAVDLLITRMTWDGAEARSQKHARLTLKPDNRAAPMFYIGAGDIATSMAIGELLGKWKRLPIVLGEGVDQFVLQMQEALAGLGYGANALDPSHNLDKSFNTNFGDYGKNAAYQIKVLNARGPVSDYSRWPRECVVFLLGTRDDVFERFIASELILDPNRRVMVNGFFGDFEVPILYYVLSYIRDDKIRGWLNDGEWFMDVPEFVQAVYELG